MSSSKSVQFQVVNKQRGVVHPQKERNPVDTISKGLYQEDNNNLQFKYQINKEEGIEGCWVGDRSFL